MGRARIVENLGEAQYKVIPLYEGRRMIINNIHGAGEYAGSVVEVDYLKKELERLDATLKEKEELLNKAIRENPATKDKDVRENLEIKEATMALQEARVSQSAMVRKVSFTRLSGTASLKRSEVPGVVDATIFKSCAFEYQEDLNVKKGEYSAMLPALEAAVNEAEGQEYQWWEAVGARESEVRFYEAKFPTVKDDLDAALAQAQIDNVALAADIDAARADLAAAKETGDEVAIAEAQEAYDNAKQAYDNAIAEDTAAERAAYEEATIGLINAKAGLKEAEKAWAEARAALMEARKKEARIKGYCDKITEIVSLAALAPAVVAWCADYNDKLVGDVGTIEVDRVGSKGHLIIQPGGVVGDQSAYQPERDGVLQPLMSATPAAGLLNYILLPGVAKWMPGYRVGEITAIDYDTGLVSVALDPLKLTHQKLDVNQSAALEDVPVCYMYCNVAAFKVGDRVVVGF